MNTEAADKDTQFSKKNDTIADLTDNMSNVHVDGHDDTLKTNTMGQPTRRLVIYPRPHLLNLHKSPLVKPPDDMPVLKDWFGPENEQSMHKKDGEGSPTSARDRARFRRDPEDADTPARPSFRGALTQPSQMGNFKHQSIRSTDRVDRDKDGDKERERDIRDKEGQERLRNLSDKYDRDRLTLPSNLTSLRNKDRDLAPHLNAGSSRLSARESALTPGSRRPEPREGAKKKIEASEDWRRGADPNRSSRDERSENSRRDRDRDDRDRPRSRVRDLSRPRRERSTSRRDRDDRDKDRRGDRDEYRRDRDDHRKERDDHLRRDRDLDKDVDAEDPRRWRDDGKRDERVAARREREYRERTRDRPPRERDEAWEDRHGGRWTVVEERDSRNKRSSGRDRRSGALDEVKEKDDRRERGDRDREREKEKEPAWMDAYIPTNSGAGILGGKGSEGELDGIQAFKRGMKAKEQKDAPEDPRDTVDSSSKIDTSPPITSTGQPSEKPLDEIQLFKLMMKKEQEQKIPENSKASVVETISAGPSLQEIQHGIPGLAKAKDHHNISVSSNAETPLVSESQSDSASATLLKGTASPKPSTNDSASQHSSDGPHALLSILASASNGTVSGPPSSTNPTTPSLDSALPKSTGSRFFPKPLSSDVSSPIASDQGSLNSQAPPQFNPPPGSRLLAFGSRNPSGASTLQNLNQQQQMQHSLSPSLQQHQGPVSASESYQVGGMQSDMNHRHPMSADTLRGQQGFSPFELQSRSAFAFDDQRDPGHYPHTADPLRRASVVSPVDRGAFSATEASAPYSNMSGHISANSDSFTVNGPGPSFDPINSGPQYGSGKGSRFLKYFEEKGRDGQVGRKPSGPSSYQSSSPTPSQRPDQSGFSGMSGGQPDNRTVDDLFAMLNTSVQGQRGNPNSQMSVGPIGGGHLGPNSNMQSIHHQQMHHQPLAPNNRLDSLYDSRLDDRNFVPDGMVPGLRQAPPPRSRDNNGMFADPLDDPMQFNPHRLPPQQRGLDPAMFPGSGPPMYTQQGSVGRNGGIPIQQSQFRSNPSPNSLQGPAQQRLPPGLANLGGRPPHEPSQFMGSSIGIPQSGGLHGPIHGNGPSPQPYNNFAANGGLGSNVASNVGGPLAGYGGGAQMRGPPPGAHHLPNPLGPNQMGHPGGSVDLRGPTNQAQLLNLGVGPNVGGGLRNAGGFPPQQGPPGQMQVPLMAMRQQQQHLPPHMLHHQASIPPHLQQQGGLPGANTQELMALLMGGGGHRE